MKKKKIVILENNIILKSKNIEKIAKYTRPLYKENSRGLNFVPIKTNLEFPSMKWYKDMKKDRK